MVLVDDGNALMGFINFDLQRSNDSMHIVGFRRQPRGW